MSRHEIPAKDGKYQVVVGWDERMRTYYAHVKDTTIFEEDDEDPIVLWLGGTFDEIDSVIELSAKLQDYAVISDVTWETLLEDRRLRRM